MDRADPGVRLAAHAPALRLLLHALAGRAVRSRVDLDDLLQEVYLRALAARPLPADDDALTGLLRTIARHTVIDVARAARARKRDGGRPLRLARGDWSSTGLRESRIADAEPGPSTRVAAEDHQRQLLAAFDALAPDHRRVIALRQFEGLSAAAAARRMGRSETAVHSLYRRALEAWSKAMPLSE